MHKRSMEGESWILVRHQGDANKWHAAVDDALGTQAKYGTPSADSQSTSSYNIPYSTLEFSRIMFANKDFSKFVIL